MTCYSPIKGYRSKHLSANGKRPLVFLEKDSTGEPQEVPCGQCIGCRLDRSRNWAARISNEASLYKDNCFITLTYSPENLPSDGSLDVRHFQLFLKRLRKKYGKVRFFHCGEYGERLGRPHYHACLLNFDFPDKQPLRTTDRGDHVYTSAALETLWGLGRTEIGSLTFESAAYVARYITKKVTGKAAEAHYTRLNLETGEIINLKPEYTTMSRKPGIGAPWLQKFSSDVYNYDKLVIRGGATIPPPRYYDNQYEVMNPEHYQKIKIKRETADKNVYGTDENRIRRLDNTEQRLQVRETVKKATVNNSLNRQLEKE